METDAFNPPVADYALIADGHTAALISKAGSIDWCCLPRFDASSCFGRLLHWDEGGFCRIKPERECQFFRRYVPDSLVLETIFRCGNMEARLQDGMLFSNDPVPTGRRQIVRILEGLAGEISFRIDIRPAFRYGRQKPVFTQHSDGFWVAPAEDGGLVVSGNLNLTLRDPHWLTGECIARKGQPIHLSLLWMPLQELADTPILPEQAEDPDQALKRSIETWQAWSRQVPVSGYFAPQVRQSAIVIKALSYLPTGAMVEAVTTSLPDSISATCNRDDRLYWIRHGIFSARSMGQLGFHEEHARLRDFIEQTAQKHLDDLQAFWTVDGKVPEDEAVLSLEGDRHQRGVHKGSRARTVSTISIFGELMALAWQRYRQALPMNEGYWRYIERLADRSADEWMRHDPGFWQSRRVLDHDVLSKAWCWSALDRAIKLAEVLDHEDQVGKWKKSRQAIREAIEESGYDRDRRVFVHAFGARDVDASLLLLPLTGFVAYNSGRMRRTTDAIIADLEVNGLLRRRLPGDIETGEAVCCACTFWLSECLANQGRLKKAHDYFRNAVIAGNDLGLLAQAFDPGKGALLGNFPSALAHFSLIAAAVALNRAGERQLYG